MFRTKFSASTPPGVTMKYRIVHGPEVEGNLLSNAFRAYAYLLERSLPLFTNCREEVFSETERTLRPERAGVQRTPARSRSGLCMEKGDNNLASPVAEYCDHDRKEQISQGRVANMHE